MVFQCFFNKQGLELNFQVILVNNLYTTLRWSKKINKSLTTKDCNEYVAFMYWFNKYQNYILN
jgi:hypothetical protein